MIKYVYEYRINKKGAECFRSMNLENIKERFQQLSAKRPNVYTIQERDLRVNRYGVPETDNWSPWKDATYVANR